MAGIWPYYLPVDENPGLKLWGAKDICCAREQLSNCGLLFCSSLILGLAGHWCQHPPDSSRIVQLDGMPQRERDEMGA